MKLKRLVFVLAGLAALLSTARAEVPADCRGGNWLARETDAQLAERVTAMSTFPTVLDPRLWNGMEMKPEIRDKTLAIVDKLFKGLRLGPAVTVTSVELFGSNASYEYDEAADFGVHAFVSNADERALSPEALQNLLRVYNGYVELWQEGKIRFNGVVLEVVFHAEPRRASYKPRPGIGQYSISRNAWIEKPMVQESRFDRKQMLADVRRWVDRWNGLVCEYAESPLTFDCTRFEALDAEMRDYRSKGFVADRGGRSTENLTYRLLRRLSVNIPDGVDNIEEACHFRQHSVTTP
jgi:hypothetical protein